LCGQFATALTLLERGVTSKGKRRLRFVCCLGLLDSRLGLRAFSYCALLTARILFTVVLFLALRFHPQPATLSSIPQPFRLEMLDDLVQYCLTEIAYEGELGTSIFSPDRVTQICLAAGSNRSVTVY